MRTFREDYGQAFANCWRGSRRCGSAAIRSQDWLPPMLGSSDWSHGIMESMADRSTAWYFDRR